MRAAGWATALGLAVMAGAGLGWGEEIAVEDLPKEVADAVNGQFPDAEITGAETEGPAGSILYEVELKQNEEEFELSVTPQGEIRSVERDIEVSQLHDVVRAAVTQKYPDAEIKEAATISGFKEGKEQVRAYEVEVTTATGRSFELVVTPDGQMTQPNEEEDDDSDDK